MMLNGKRVVLLDKEGNKFEVSPETIQLLGTVKLSLSGTSFCFPSLNFMFNNLCLR